MLFFFLTPIVEMYLLIEVAGYIDAWPTIALVMLTAVVGVALLKRQGVATLTRGVQRMQQGQMPATEMAEGILLAVAGALLITPGFVTDFVGFMLLFPPSRIVIAKSLMSRVMMNGAVAKRAGLPGYARYVGTTLGKLPKDTRLPWHRVVNASRKIAPRGSARMLEQKRRLKAEGVTFNGETVLKDFYW